MIAWIPCNRHHVALLSEKFPAVLSAACVSGCQKEVNLSGGLRFLIRAHCKHAHKLLREGGMVFGIVTYLMHNPDNPGLPVSVLEGQCCGCRWLPL